ncbi:DNA-binding MarR family transcriptional regulator [Agromyces hippuratus]|uniref:DNA-binding MarR family transcriptional regulator n=1 Tax=Agromyces hippuratus TaxID=286438 RepID=A0A852WZH7_9MICO|nr:MarR family winged helix-turn-helix transcriptional regulator [Agromyces hippuratus]NYG21620.1 DNA-binding MarR family transcriptional regulator [Agromyces hippuratus]
MNASSQVPPGERSGSDAAGPASNDPIALIEQALVTMRRDQERRRLQRRAEHFGREGHDGHGGGHSHDHPHGHRHDGRHPDEHPGHADHEHGEGAELDDHRGRRGGGRGGPDGWGGRGRGRGPGGGPGRHALAHAARFRLLDALEGAERPPSVSQLAEAIGVDQPRASRLVQAAVEAGHVRREADPSDARRSALVLTASGRKLLESARDTRRGAVETALAAFTPEETAEFARLLSRFIADWPRD